MGMEEEIDIKDLFLAIWIKKWIILGVTFIFLIFGLIMYARGLKNNTTVLKRTVSKSSENLNLCYVETNFMLSRGKSVKLEEDYVQSTYKLNIDAGVITNLNQFATSKQFLETVLKSLGYGEEIDIDDVKSNIIIFGNGNSDVITLIVGFENEGSAIDISQKILDELRDKIDKLYEIEEIITIDGPEVLNKKEIKALEEKIVNPDSIVEKDDNKNENSKASKKKVILIAGVRFCSFLWYCSFN